MEKINTDYKQQIWKIEAKLFNMLKPWLSSFKMKMKIDTHNSLDHHFHFHLSVVKTKTKPITYQLDYAANLKS